jgi:hypothetical protein
MLFTVCKFFIMLTLPDKVVSIHRFFGALKTHIFHSLLFLTVVSLKLTKKTRGSKLYAGSNFVRGTLNFDNFSCFFLQLQ